MSMATKPGRVVTNNEEFLSLKSSSPLIMWSFKITRRQIKIILSPTTAIPMANKLCKVVTYPEGISFIKSYDLLITSTCEVT